MEFLAIFREVPDPRVERTRVHPLINILTIAPLQAAGRREWTHSRKVSSHGLREEVEFLRSFCARVEELLQVQCCADACRAVFFLCGYCERRHMYCMYGHQPA